MAVFLGSYVQGITGFALGIVVMAIVAAAQVYDVADMAAVIIFSRSSTSGSHFMAMLGTLIGVYG